MRCIESHFRLFLSPKNLPPSPIPRSFPPLTLHIIIVVYVLGTSRVHHHVDGVRDVQVEVGGPLVRVQRRTVRVVHLGAQVGTDEALGQSVRQRTWSEKSP